MKSKIARVAGFWTIAYAAGKLFDGRISQWCEEFEERSGIKPHNLR